MKGEKGGKGDVSLYLVEGVQIYLFRVKGKGERARISWLNKKKKDI